MSREMLKNFYTENEKLIKIINKLQKEISHLEKKNFIIILN